MPAIEMPVSERSAGIRVLLVDDHELVRMGFRLLLEAAPGVEVIGEANSGEAAMQWLHERRTDREASSADTAANRAALPNVAVVDISMTGISGIELTRQMLARLPDLKVLALSAHEDASHVRHLLRAGGMGYLSKRAAPHMLTDAIRCVAKGQRYLDAELARAIALAELSPAPSAGEADRTEASDAAARSSAVSGQPVQALPEAVSALSEREHEVFLQLARGATVANIAERLHISPRTVGTHLYHVKQKTGARNQAELTLLAIRNGLLKDV